MNKKLPTVIYSHSDYADVLKIQTDYIESLDNKILFINRNNSGIDDIISKYNNIIYYDDSYQYGNRLFECLSKLDVDIKYILFLHDIDIIIEYEESMLEFLLETMKLNFIDRIDLKHVQIEPTDWFQSIDVNTNLILQKNINKYIYNVNPSLWKVDALREIMENHKTRTYRDIENIDVQQFCYKYTIFKLNSIFPVKAGYFECVPFFKFIHITHSGKYLPLNDTFTTIYGQSYDDIKSEYQKIVNQYELRKSNKWIN